MSEKIEHEGVISRIDKGRIWVTIVQKSACADCHAQSMCQLSEQKEKCVEIPNVDTSFLVGDKVVIVGNSSLGLQAVMYAFVIPLILIVVALAICLSQFSSESLAASVAVVVLAVYFFVLYAFREKFKKKFVFEIK